MSILLDTSFIFAFFNKKDEHHESAEKIMQALRNGLFGKLFISDYVFDEFVTLAGAHLRFDLAEEWGQALLDSQKIEFLTTDNDEFKTAWELFKQFKELSFTDCTLLSISKHLGIDNIASFDSDFDKTKAIKRIAEV
ncbi:MAG: PIN domain-containing protein [Nanoarchaeota archaeon]